jgi:hypothetical protein
LFILFFHILVGFGFLNEAAFDERGS